MFVYKDCRLLDHNYFLFQVNAGYRGVIPGTKKKQKKEEEKRSKRKEQEENENGIARGQATSQNTTDPIINTCLENISRLSF